MTENLILSHLEPGSEAGLRILVFVIGGEPYACDVLGVEEIVADSTVHPLPDIPPPLAGVIRMRGALVPVVEIAPLLGLVRRAAVPSALIVAGAEHRLGILVDEVREVVGLPESALRPSPNAGAADEAEIGVVHLDGEIVTVLELGQLLGANIIQSIRGSS